MPHRDHSGGNTGSFSDSATLVRHFTGAKVCCLDDLQVSARRLLLAFGFFAFCPVGTRWLKVVPWRSTPFIGNQKPSLTLAGGRFFRLSMMQREDSNVPAFCSLCTTAYRTWLECCDTAYSRIFVASQLTTSRSGERSKHFHDAGCTGSAIPVRVCRNSASYVCRRTDRP